MSDAPQGPGWWQSSNAKWYPPEKHPDYVPSLTESRPPPPSDPGARFAAGCMWWIVIGSIVVTLALGYCVLQVGDSSNPDTPSDPIAEACGRRATRDGFDPASSAWFEAVRLCIMANS